MRNFVSKEDLLLEIGTSFSKMENGKLLLEELNNLVNNTKDLYERSIILRYKAMEEKVFGIDNITKTDDDIQVNSTHSESKEDLINTLVDFENEEIVINELDLVDEVKAVVKESHSFGFNLFDYEDEVKDEPIEVLEEQSFSFKSDIDSEMEENYLNIDNSLDIKNIEEGTDQVRGEVEQASYFDEIAAEEQNIVNEEVGQPTSFSYSELSPFIHKFDQVQINDSAQFGIVKIESLLGSFGLNERLQYINELFDGSSENFSDAIKILDNQISLDTAKTKVAELGILNQWEIESETIQEFIQKVVRRYA